MDATPDDSHSQVRARRPSAPAEAYGLSTLTRRVSAAAPEPLAFSVARGEPAPGPSLPASAAASVAELAVFDDEDADAVPSDEEAAAQIAALPPIDGGRPALLFLAAATIIEVMVWGLPFSVGLLRAHWADMFPDDASTVALAATLPSGILYFAGAVLGPLLTAVPWYERRIQLVGLVVAALGLVTCGFATKAWHLVATFGCLYPFAVALYFPCPLILFEWFHAKRGLASGVMYAGTGAGGTIFPFIVSALLARIGYCATMVTLGLLFPAVCAPALLFVRRRVPVARPSAPRRARLHKVDWGFLRGPAPWVGFAFVTLANLGNIIPLVWMPTFASTVHANGTVLVSLMNAVTIPGFPLNGYLSDHLPARLAILTSFVVAALASALLWGFGTQPAALFAFVLVWGASAGCMTAFWSRLITTIADGDPQLPMLVMAIFSCLKGVGSLTSGPVSTALLKLEPWHGAAGAYGATNYGGLFLYTSGSTLLGGLAASVFPS
ncbi:hypothetical protein Q8F55_006686 [Vanrija albida]|uniref:Major facilitator superfamily (MFS) profile domain-containing protein n=1 Tax=Vanrija albida TaxID=181172 RepID=A0ABR3PYT1_9TREE